MHFIIQRINRFSELLGHLLAWLTLVMALLLLTVVALRYVFEIGSIALQESVLYLHGAILLLGAGFTLKHDAHVRVDVFYRGFSKHQQAWVNLLGNLLFLLPVTVFIGAVSWEYVWVSWQRLEGSAEAGGLPLVFIQKSLILAFVVTFTLQAIAQLMISIGAIKGDD
ncbi:TRAP transporter small permease subunit [Paraferrimonas haliotis]|uniref:TRAP transporter small permease protein n=1 Tax=Paraferrimonas haliotis TaxID=2013866 RepID=A0AA37TLV3_9GAMM|nr:TRAP transporter small permease subunit [Paraferrimonas haliotis]GLS82768.1 C4-dicarboxylate ABC transporter substrate-binding protein [Paraferrimonas haliotis]